MLSSDIVAELRAAVGSAGLIVDENQLQTYECDALTNLRTVPGAVTMPEIIR